MSLDAPLAKGLHWENRAPKEKSKPMQNAGQVTATWGRRGVTFADDKSAGDSYSAPKSLGPGTNICCTAMTHRTPSPHASPLILTESLKASALIAPFSQMRGRFREVI